MSILKPLISLMMISSFCLSDCTDALNKCQSYNLKLEENIKLKDEKITVLLRQRDEALKLASDSQPLLPAWTYVVIGMAAGSLLVIGLKK